MADQTTRLSRDRVRSARLAHALELLLRAAVLLLLLVGVVRPLVGSPVLGLAHGPFWGSAGTVDVVLDPSSLTGADLSFPELPAVMGRGEIPRGDGLEFIPELTATVAIASPDFRQSVLITWAPILSSLAVIAGMLLTIGVLRTLRRGDVFVSSNVRRLYAIAGIVAVGGMAIQGLSLWGYFGIMRHPSAAPYVLDSWEISWLPLVAGLAVAIVAEVFRQGLAIRADTVGLV